jgi:ribonuclease HI
MVQVDLFTDGAAKGNPGPGGYGAILRSGAHEKELSGGFYHTTNNRMELMAVIVGIEALKSGCSVRVVSDSKYVVDAFNARWIDRICGSACSKPWSPTKCGLSGSRATTTTPRTSAATAWRSRPH